MVVSRAQLLGLKKCATRHRILLVLIDIERGNIVGIL